MNHEQRQISNILTVIFYLLALAAVVLYFITPDKAQDRLWMYLGFGAIGVRLITYFLRYLL
ncbi:MAG: hypothetical protein Q4F97_00390 [Bacteroidales bacterium]|nr:hypothetical protein [Bacteroidales bacterium]